MKRRIMSALVAVALVVSMIPAVTAAEVGINETADSLYNSTEEISTEDDKDISEEDEINYPEIQSIVPIQGGFNISWSSYEGAAGYKVYVRTADLPEDTWTELGYTADLSITHTGLKNNTEYIYTVISLNSDGLYISSYNSEGWAKRYLDSPALTSVQNVYGGVKVSWSKVTGAEKYRVFVKNGSSWKALGDTTAASFTDTSVTSGKAYTYTVRCISADGSEYTSYYNKSGKSVTYVAAPQITKIENVTNGSSVTWGKVAGAAKYRLYVKNGTSWKKVGDTTALTLTHTGLKNNTEYIYTVRALDKNGSLVSSYNSEGWSNKYLTTPEITSAHSVYGGVKITWNKISGAEKYRVFVKNGTSWKTLGDTTAVSFTDKNVTSGKAYTYTVRCISADLKSFTSYYNKSGKSVTYVAAPKITKIENVANGSKVSWGKVAGAAKYRLYYVDSNNTWKAIGTTTSTSLTHENLKTGTTYRYTVRALNSSGGYASGYYSAGWTNIYLAPPAISSVTKTDDGTLLSWKAISSAAGYRVYRKPFGGSWSTLANVTGTTYTDTTAKSNTLYTYTLRCLDKNGKLISYYLPGTTYYYNGALANGNITVNGKSYYFSDGCLRQGYVTVNGATYYYNSSGVLQKNGVVGNKQDGYCYADKNGKIDYTFTGIAKNSNGYWYCKKGRVDFTCRNGITYGGSDWIVLDGKATKVVADKDRTLFRALKVVAKITDSSMTKSEKLKTCFDYVKTAYTEKNPRIPHYKGMDWPELYANDMFVDGAGNCFSYASAFAYMAKAIGYENVYCCSSGGHGWAEINGLVYDPEWSRHSNKSTYYGISYNASTDVNYKAGISPGYAWMHIKI